MQPEATSSVRFDIACASITPIGAARAGSCEITTMPHSARLAERERPLSA